MPPLSFSTRLTLLALLSSSSVYLLLKSRLLHRLPLLLSATTTPTPPSNPRSSPYPKSPTPKIFCLSQTGTSRALSERLLALLPGFCLVDPSDYEPEDVLSETLVLFVASTWEDGGPPEGCRFLFDFIGDCAADFRVGRVLERRCRFAVFGVGSGVYGEERYNRVGKELRRWLKELGGEEMVEFGEGDVSEGRVDEVFDEWSRKLARVLSENGKGVSGGVSGAGMVEEGDDDEGDDTEEEIEEEHGVVDLEDVAGKWVSPRKDRERNGGTGDGKKVMVTPVIRASLEKQV